MANPEHVEILVQGSEKWNSWRAKNPQVVPDLSNLHIPFDVQVQGTLAGANFRNANLTRVTGLGGDRDWTGAIPSMEGADFSGADLSRSSFWRADFSGSNFYKANLDGADFEYVHLTMAQMIQTSIRGASFGY